MKAIVYHGPREVTVEDVPEPRPGPGELLLRPAYACICFTDKHRYEGLEYGVSVTAGGRAYPWRDGMVIGHEFSATVEAVGAEVDGWRVGDRVTVEPRTYCGECLHCRGGHPMLCEGGGRSIGSASNGLDGGFAELCVVPAYCCYRIPDGISLEAASLAEPLCCATRGVRHSGTTIGDNTVVLGASDYGMFAAQWLRHAGAKHVVLGDPLPVRRRAGEGLEITMVDTSTDEAKNAVGDLMPRGADVVVVALEDYIPASRDYLTMAFDFCRTGGRVMLIRVYGVEPYARMNPLMPLLKEITILHNGNFFGLEPLRGGRARGDWQVSLDALEKGWIESPPGGASVIDFEDIRTQEDVDEVFRAIPTENTKTIFRIGAPRSQSSADQAVVGAQRS